MPRAIALSSPPPVSTSSPFLPFTIAVPVSWHDGSTPPAAMHAFFSSSSATKRSLGDASGSSRIARSCARWPGRRKCAMSNIASAVSRRERRGVDLRGSCRPAGLERRHAVGREEPVRACRRLADREQVLVREVGGHQVERYRRSVRLMAAAERWPTYRIEHDSMGEVRVPADALWGAQTQRAVENFPISGRPIERGADPARWR